MTRTQDLRMVGISWLVSSRYSSRLPPNSLGWPPPILTLDLPIRLLLMKSRMYSVQHIILSYQSNQSVWNSHILIQLSFGKFSCEIKVANSWLEQNRFSLTTFFDQTIFAVFLVKSKYKIAVFWWINYFPVFLVKSKWSTADWNRTTLVWRLFSTKQFFSWN